MGENLKKLTVGTVARNVQLLTAGDGIAISNAGVISVDGDDYYSKTEVDTLLDDYYTKTEVDTELDDKVDKVTGKGLSTNDYTTAEKTKLAGIADGAEVNVQSDWNVTDTTSDAFIKNKPTIPDVSNFYTKTQVDTALGNKVDKVTGKGLSTNDYSNADKAIVDAVTTNLAGKVDKVTGKGLSTNDYTNADKAIVDAVTTNLNGKVDKVTGKGLSTNDYTNADKAIVDGVTTALAGKQNTLTAGSNITISGNTISATDTKYTAGTGIAISSANVISATGGGGEYTAGTGLSLSGNQFSVKLGYTTSGNNRKVQADSNGNLYVVQKDDGAQYTAGTNVQISASNVISATDTKYTAGTGLSLSSNQFSVKTGYTTSGNNRKVQTDTNGNLYVVQKDDDTKYSATKENIGSASGWSAGSLPTLGTAIKADDITAWSAGTLPTLGTAIKADDITAWRPGTLPTLGTAIPADDITAWSPGTTSSSSVSGCTLTLRDSTAPTLTYTAKTIPNVTGVGTLPSLTYSEKTIPNVTNVGSLPTLTYSEKTIPNVTGVGSLPTLTVTTKSVVTDITEQ